ncbi:MAG: VWA domain-containing protein [Phycisphaerales bacterium]|nr:VWA domain-containing protein [Phycisphaerales bacterium]
MLRAAAGPLLRTWASRILIVALAVSVLFHLTGLMLASVYRLGVGGGPGAGTGTKTPVEFAVVSEAELASLQRGAEVISDVPAPIGDGVSSESPGTRLTLDDMTASDLLGSGDSPGTAFSASDISGSLGDGAVGAGAGGGGGGGGASFFGVEAQGNRFAYVVDVSGSMSVGGKLEALQHELTQSVNQLLETSSITIVPFSSQYEVLGSTNGKATWIDANDRNKKGVVRNITTLRANGGTNPGPAFVLVFSMKPRPDAIYFMTDGEFPEQIASEIMALNAEYKIPIHCICFVSDGAADMMKVIAQKSGGTYTFVPGPRP